MSNFITFPLDNTDYTANDMALYFSGRTSGVYAQTGELDVTSNNNMTVTITPGRAWITPTKFRGIVFASMVNVTLPIAIADGILNRIDRVVIKYDIVKNESTIYIKKGTANSVAIPPTLERDGNSAYELAIADIYIGAGSTLIRSQDITDKRLDSSVCGIVSDGITNVSTTVLENSFNSWLTSTKTNFNVWLAGIQGQLDGDIATNLSNSINLLKGRATTTEAETKKLDTATKASNVEINAIKVKINEYSSYASDKDNFGVYKLVEYKRPDGTLYMKSTLALGTAPRYTRDTWQFYNEAGTSVISTKIWTIAYDTNGVIISKVVV